MKAETITTFDGVRELGPAWTGLLQRSGESSVFVTHEWIANWLAHFGQGHRIHFVVLREAGEVLAIAPFVVATTRWRRLPARLLTFCTNSHSQRGGVIMLRDAEARLVPSLIEHLYRDAVWDVAALDGMRPSSGAALCAAAGFCGLRAFVTGGHEQSYLSLPPTWERYLETPSRKLKQTLRRAKERLGEIGRLEFDYADSPGSQTAAMAEFEAIDSASWKQTNGESVVSGSNIRSFYNGLGGAFGRDGRMLVGIMRVNGEPASGIVCLRNRGTLFGLKISYKERLSQSGVELKSFSPGSVLLFDVMQRAIAQGLGELDFVNESPWSERFTPLRRSYDNVVMFHRCWYARLLDRVDRHVRGFQSKKQLRQTRIFQ